MHLHEYCAAVGFELGTDFIVEPRRMEPPDGPHLISGAVVYHLKVTHNGVDKYSSHSVRLDDRFDKRQSAVDAAIQLRIAFNGNR